MQVQARVADGEADGEAAEEWVHSGVRSTRPDDHPVAEYLNSIELGEDSDFEEGATEGRDDPKFWPKNGGWPKNVDVGRRTTRDQALKGAEHLLNFMDANPDCMSHFKGGCGGATVYLLGMRRGVELCLEPVGQRHATLEEMEGIAEARKRRQIREHARQIGELAGTMDKAKLDDILKAMRALHAR